MAREFNEISGGLTPPEVNLDSKLLSVLKFVHVLCSNNGLVLLCCGVVSLVKIIPKMS